MTTDLLKKLDQLADYQAQRDYLQLQKQELIDQTIPPEIKARLDEIEAEFEGRAAAVAENITQLEADIKKDILTHGATVRGTFLRANFIRGRVSWDDEGLNGYAKAHPEVLAFRRQGNPYVSIVKI